jgi:hypothetical protein
MLMICLSHKTFNVKCEEIGVLLYSRDDYLTFFDIINCGGIAFLYSIKHERNKQCHHDFKRTKIRQIKLNNLNSIFDPN